MRIDENDISKFVSSPSLGAVIYQAHVLIEELKNINNVEFPLQAQQIRDVLLCLTEYILDQLCELNAEDTPEKNSVIRLKRGQELGKALQEIYSYIEHLSLSSPHQDPPEVQFAVTKLISVYFPNLDINKPVCLVSPQWKYNLCCFNLSQAIEQLISPGTLDPYGYVGIVETEDIIPELWKRRFYKLKDHEKKDLSELPPKQISIISFAGLDTYDTLLYPLLAHEIGHFIHYNYKYSDGLAESLVKALDITREQVEDVLANGNGAKPGEDTVVAAWDKLVERTRVCFTELMTDLIATRMLGFAFFAAQSEFLKTISSWPERIILDSGYPGIKFRLRIIFNHMITDTNPGNISAFLQKYSDDQYSETIRYHALSITKYIEKWKDRLEEQENNTTLDEIDIQDKLDSIAEKAINCSLNILERIVEDLIPNDRCARLSDTFFTRIDRLKQDIPPAFSNDEPNSFAEIMSASWTYQILYGEKNERSKMSIEKKFNEYNKTCMIVLKDIELINDSSLAPSKNDIKPEEVSTTPDKDIALANQGGILSYSHIRQRITELDIGHPSHLEIVPLNLDAIQAASLDVRLGHWFAVDRRIRLSHVRLGERTHERMLRTIGREEIFVPTGGTFLLHPGDFVRGITLEFIALPADLMAYVEGKSGVGRTGLTVATATPIAPGFHGVVVLELANTGTVPLKLTPGIDIAQLVFHVMAAHVLSERLYRGQYYCQIKP